MATGVSILCYKSKTLANGAHPLMIRLCKDGKKQYVSLGVSVLPQFWDFEKNKPKRNYPSKALIDKLIASKMAEYNALVVDMEDTTYISSVGLRAFVSAQKKLNKSGGTMVLTHVKPCILEIFEVTGFAGVLTIESDD